MMRRVAVIAVATLVATLFAPAAPARSACGALETYYLETFHIEAEPLEPTYRIGQTVRFHLTITRPAHKDPLGLGIPLDPPRSEPVADAFVSVSMFVGPEGEEAFLYGVGRSSQEGKVVIPVKLKKYVKPGWAHARAYAQKVVVENVANCFSVFEFGVHPMPEAFRAVR